MYVKREINLFLIMLALCAAVACARPMNAAAAADNLETDAAQAFMDKREYSRAVEIYGKLLAEDTQNVNLMFNMGTALGYLNEQTRAIEVLKKCAAITENSLATKKETLELEILGHIYNNLSKSYIALEKFDDAAAACKKGIASHPGLSWLHYNLGEAEQAKGNYEVAIGSYQKALKIDPKDLSADLKIVECYYSLKKYAPAFELLNELIKIYPENIEIKFNLGSALFKLDRKEEAVKIWQEIAARVPDSNFGRISKQWLDELNVQVEISPKTDNAGSRTIECTLVSFGFSFLKPPGYFILKNETTSKGAFYMLSRNIYDEGVKKTVEVSLTLSVQAIESPQSYNEFARTWEENQRKNGSNYQKLYERDMEERNGVMWEYEADFNGVLMKGATFACIIKNYGFVVWLNATRGTYSIVKPDFDLVFNSLK